MLKYKLTFSKDLATVTRVIPDEARALSALREIVRTHNLGDPYDIEVERNIDGLRRIELKPRNGQWLVSLSLMRCYKADSEVIPAVPSHDQEIWKLIHARTTQDFLLALRDMLSKRPLILPKELTPCASI